jgi:anti-anti-sigma factor
MLGIEMEFRKGILFVRLSGELTERTIDKLNSEVTDIIRENGIRNVVFNVKDLNTIDMYGINMLYYNYQLTSDNQGKSLLCGMKNTLVKHRIQNSQLLNYMFEASDELSAFNVMRMWS